MKTKIGVNISISCQRDEEKEKIKVKLKREKERHGLEMLLTTFKNVFWSLTFCRSDKGDQDKYLHSQ